VSSASSLSTAQLETAIAQIDTRLTHDAHAYWLHLDRGQFLEMLGRKDEAVTAYINVLRLDSTNVDALNALGLLTLASGNRDAARTLLRGAVLHGPAHAAAHANLAYISMLDGQHDGARTLYERALALDPELAIAHHGYANLLARTGDEGAAEEHRRLGLRYRPITINRYIGEGRPIHILGLGTSSAGNTPTYGYFDNRVFALSSLIIEHADLELPLPPHDIVFNAIGEADLCTDQLRRAAIIADRTDAPIINHPRAVLATSRAANAQRLRQLAGVSAPIIVAFARVELTGPAAGTLLRSHGFTFPLLVRSPGYHTGDHFVKVDASADLADAIATLPGDELLVIEYIDVRDAAGDYRKFRAIIVDGELYPLHLAISRNWKVHYFSADMATRADHRAADAAYLLDMRATLGERACAALTRVRELLALDYGGIDFALDAAGDIIVFEANASMIVPPPDPGAMWEYRRAPVDRIRHAVHAMLVGRAAQFATANSAVSSPA
jgi:hypothetical protein